MLRCNGLQDAETVSCFTNPVSRSAEDNELFFLSLGVPAKPVIAKDLIEADGIRRKDVGEFIYSHLVENLSYIASLNATS